METTQAHAPPVGDPPSQPPKKQSNKPPGGFKRKRTGCSTCRQRKIRCDERKPSCSNCEKSKRECRWVGGYDIFKHDQNPSVAEKRETKFYRGSASSWKAEDEQRLTTPSNINREFQFVSMNNDAREPPPGSQVHPHPPPIAAGLQPSPYQHMDLQALASAATYMPLPPTTYGESDGHGADAMIDPNLDGATGNGIGQSTFQSTTEPADEKSRDIEEIETVVARALTAAGESDLQRAGEAANRAESSSKTN